MKFTIPETIPRAALVTGGARQSAIVNALTDAGFAVALQCQPGDETDVPAGTLCCCRQISPTKDRPAALLGRATDALGPIGVLINAASTIERDTWDDATRATWDMHIETNLRAPFVLIQQFARKHFHSAREGVVINPAGPACSVRILSPTPYRRRRCGP